MNLKAIFPAGATELTVNGLHQWDYGRKLDIHAPDLPAIVEVHFACPGMDEAIVRVGSAAGGVVTVAIPDRCLEQSSPITAWVYEVGENYGQTLKTLTLNIMTRTRPQTAEAIDPENSDKYTEAVAAMNEAVATLQNGDIKAKEADHATTADSATEADEVSTIVLETYEQLMELIQRNNASGTYAIATNDGVEIDVGGLGTIPPYTSGMLVVDLDAHLTLTRHNGNVISAYYDGVNKKWTAFKTLKQKPDEAGSMSTIVLKSYDQLIDIIESNNGYGTYAIAVNDDAEIAVGGLGTIPYWTSGMLVVDTDAALTLTNRDGNVISAYYDGVNKIWTAFQTLKQKPDEASQANIVVADVGTPYSNKYIYTTGVYVVDLHCDISKGSVDTYSTTVIIFIDDISDSKKVCFTYTDVNGQKYEEVLYYQGGNGTYGQLYVEGASGEDCVLKVARIADVVSDIAAG